MRELKYETVISADRELRALIKRLSPQTIVLQPPTISKRRVNQVEGFLLMAAYLHPSTLSFLHSSTCKLEERFTNRFHPTVVLFSPVGHYKRRCHMYSMICSVKLVLPCASFGH
ncbi:hypothetical protein BDV93DRAFT_279198 [Ceratobasidium sp. AG-I]|nr:hypothetical protein BDV93DRAFT_279198 [Ceratobasidium sp. AG-I]